MTAPESTEHAATAAELNEALTHHRLGEVAIAAQGYRRVLAKAPGTIEAWQLLALAIDGGASEAASCVLLRAASLPSGSPELLGSVGGILAKKGLVKAANLALRRSVALAPSSAGTWNGKGVASRLAGDFDAAIAELQRAIALERGFPDAVDNLTAIYLRCGEARRARQLLDASPIGDGGPGLLARRVSISLLLDEEPPETTLRLAREFERRYVTSENQLGYVERSREPDRRLRIGYVSGNAFRMHTTAMVLLPVFRNHDRREVEVFCYSDVLEQDEDHVTDLFRSHASTFRVTGSLDDAGLAQLIREDRIDVLVDSLGFAAGSRLLALGRRPAPVQVNWMAMGSFGMRAVGYAVADNLLVPPDADRCFDEKVVRVSCGYVCEPLLPLPPPPLSQRRNGPVTFGSLNQLAKLSERTLDLWARILAAAPRSRLLLKAEVQAGSAVVERIRARFADRGIAGNRIEFEPWRSTYQDHLAVYDQIDVALDTVPYGGATTTLEALLMGVPVVSQIGDRVLGRYGYMFLATLGLDDLAAASDRDYVRIAIELAADVERRKELRGTLRTRLLASPICDGARMARELEGAYREMWREWCGQPPS
ncbi:MAG: hypothetical protein JNL04_12655 [Rhodospirillaceae bacterium]|nr:hypothetical protein [Rhodospirillaceae bacterium]